MAPSQLRARLVNPTFELAYWHWALTTAQVWLTRMGRARNARWDRVLNNLTPPAVHDGVYVAIAVDPFTIRTDNPSMLAALGMLPRSPLVDERVMARTLDDVVREWEWESTWGWDYPGRCIYSKIDLLWHHGRYQGGVGSYRTDGPAPVKKFHEKRESRGEHNGHEGGGHDGGGHNGGSHNGGAHKGGGHE